MNMPREPAGFAARPIHLGGVCLGFLLCLFAVTGSADLSPLQAQSQGSVQRYVQLIERLDRPEPEVLVHGSHHVAYGSRRGGPP